MTKYVYSFGRGKAEGSSVMRNLLGGKGCELAEMTNLGIPVPPGFTITTQAWAAYNRVGPPVPRGAVGSGASGLEKLEQDADLVLGDPKRPLLVSVRSGARVSMPGMMETVLNLGLNDATVEGLAAWTGQRALRLGLLPALHHDVRRRGAGHPARGLRRAARRAQEAARRADRPRGAGRRASEARRRRFKDIVSERTGRAVPPGPARAAPPGRPRRVRLLVRQEGHRVPPHQQHPGRLGDGGDRDVDGLRQPRRDLRHRRRLHARSPHGRAALLRRVPRQRPGRGRGGGHPDTRAHRRPQAPHAGDLRRAADDRRTASSATTRTCRTSSSRSRRASSTSSRPAPASGRRRPPCAWPWISCTSR